MSRIICKPHPRYSGYWVSNDGCVFSEWTRQGLRGGKRLMKGTTDPRGYVRVWIRDKRTGEFVHKMVLETFKGPRPDYQQARHRNGVRADNRLCNLTWGTAKENANDRLDHGNTVRGTNVPSAKLRPTLVLKIRKQYATGLISQRELARVYKVSRPTIRRIVCYESWRSV